MRRLLGLLVVVASLTTGALSGSPADPAPVRRAALEAWAFDSMTRLTRTSPAGSSSVAELSAARGETESFQLGVRASTGRLTGGDLTVSELAGPAGAVIPQAAVTRFREQFVRVRRHSPRGSGPIVDQRWFPDALLPFVDPATGAAPDPAARYAAAPYAVDAGHTQPFWVDVTVPRTAPAGSYTGTWTVHTDQGDATGTVHLTVRGFALPLTPAEPSSFGIYHGHRTATTQLLLRYGIQPTAVAAAEQPDAVSRGLGVTDAGFWSGALVSSCAMEPPPTVRQIRHRVAAFDPAVRVYNYTADEISRCPGLTPRLEQWSRRLHRAGVEQLVTMVPTWQLLDDGTGRPAVDIWVLLPEQLQRLSPRLRQAVLDRGGEIWSYQALTQGANTPSWEIDVPPANFRVLPGFLNAATGTTGVLYWSVDYWQPNPWADVVYTDSGCCYPGDGTLVYPGGPAGVRNPIPSVRLAWIRDGLDDYAYADLARRAGLDVPALVAPAAGDWTHWSDDPTALASARDRLAAALGG
jgi:hypothetical protein